MTEVTKKLMGITQSFDIGCNAGFRLAVLSWWKSSSGVPYVKEFLFSLFGRRWFYFLRHCVYSKPSCIAHQYTYKPFKLPLKYTYKRHLPGIRVLFCPGKPDGLCIFSTECKRHSRR